MNLRNDSRGDFNITEYSEGIGLRGIRERLDTLGGSIQTRPLFDGFEMTITVPFRENSDDTNSDS